LRWDDHSGEKRVTPLEIQRRLGFQGVNLWEFVLFELTEDKFGNRTIVVPMGLNNSNEENIWIINGLSELWPVIYVAKQKDKTIAEMQHLINWVKKRYRQGMDGRSQIFKKMVNETSQTVEF